MEDNEVISLGDATIDGISKTKFMMSLDSEWAHSDDLVWLMLLQSLLRIDLAREVIVINSYDLAYQFGVSFCFLATWAIDLGKLWELANDLDEVTW